LYGTTWRRLSCTKHSANRFMTEFFGGNLGRRATIPTSFETDWFSAGFNRPKPRFGFSVKVTTRRIYETWNREQ
jgi:hypothetical protein